MLSTHIMQEAEAICDRVVIISKGEIVTNKTTAQLQNDASGKSIYVEFQQEVSGSVLKKIKGVNRIEPYQKGWLLQGESIEDIKINVSRMAQEKNWVLMTLKTESKSLAEIFKDLTL